MTDREIIFTKICNPERSMNEIYDTMFSRINKKEKFFVLLGHGSPFFHKRLRKTLGNEAYIISIEDETFRYSWKCMTENRDVVFVNMKNPKQIKAILIYILSKINMKKFDCIIMNPPYSGDLHLEILQECIDFIKEDGQIVNLSPVRWILDPLFDYRKEDKSQKCRKNIEKHINELNVFDKQKSKEMFDCTTEPLGLYILTSNGSPDFNIDRSFGKKIIDRLEKSYKDYMNHPETPFWVPVAKFHWTSEEKDIFIPFSLSLSENGNYAKSGWTKALHDTYEIFYFDTEEELNNFKDFLELKSYKWILGKLLNGKRLSTQFIPMMPTYTHPWTDEMIYKYFGLTSDEISDIEKTS